MSDTIQELMAQMTPATGTPDDGTKPSWTGLLGSVLGGGQTPGYKLRGGEADTAGNRALLNFGINMLMASGPHAVRPDVLTAAATGLQGAQESLGQDQQRAGALAAAQQTAQIARIRTMLPLLQLRQQAQAGANAAKMALGGAPATSIGATGGSADVPAEYLPFFQEASQKTGIPVGLLIAQAKQESGFNANATGGAGEVGIMQILPSTARNPGGGMTGVDPKDLRDPRANILFGAQYLAARLPKGASANDPAAIEAALKAYNGGGDPNYVRNVLRYVPGAQAGVVKASAPPATGANAPVQIPPATPPIAGSPPPPPGQQAATPPAPGTAVVAGPGAPTDTATPPAQVQPPAVFTPRQLTPSEQAATSYALPPEQEAGFRRGVAEVSGQPDAAAKIAAIEQARTAAIATQREKADAARLAIEAADRGAWQKQQEDAAKFAREDAAKQAAATVTHQRALEIEKAKSGLTVEQQGAAASLAGDTDRMKKSGEAAAAMLPVSEQLRQLPALMRGLPPGGLISSVIGRYPAVTSALESAGIVNPGTTDNVSLFLGLTNHLSTQLRVSGSGSMSDKDLATFKTVLPQLLASPDGRLKAVAFLQNIADRVVQGQEFIQDYFRRVDRATGKPAYNLSHLSDAINAPRRLDENGINQGGLGPVVPEAPRFSGPNAYNEASTWLRNNVQSGHPYTAWLPDEKGQMTQQILVRE